MSEQKELRTGVKALVKTGHFGEKMGLLEKNGYVKGTLW